MVRKNKNYCTRLLTVMIASLSFSALSYGAVRRAVAAVPRPVARPGARSFSGTPVQPWYRRPAYDRVLKLRNPVPSAVLGASTGVVFAGSVHVAAQHLDERFALLSKHSDDFGLFPAMIVGGVPGALGYSGALLVAQGYCLAKAS